MYIYIYNPNILQIYFVLNWDRSLPWFTRDPEVTPLSLTGTIKFTQVYHYPWCSTNTQRDFTVCLIVIYISGGRRSENKHKHTTRPLGWFLWTLEDIPGDHSFCLNSRKCVSNRFTWSDLNEHFNRSNQYNAWMYSQLKNILLCLGKTKQRENCHVDVIIAL